MVAEQLTARGIRDPRVLAAMGATPRESFVAPESIDLAYADRALPIPYQQTISQPYTVAFMCEAAQIVPTDQILEIGTGSGYGAAVLSQLGQVVHSIERVPQLGAEAAERFVQLGYKNIHVHIGDGTLGWPPAAPYDAIIVTAGADALPRPYIDQLREGGRIVIPIGHLSRSQTMYRFTLRDRRLLLENLGGFAFVPLIGQCSWQADDAENQ